jgi:hypothetical protein
MLAGSSLPLKILLSPPLKRRKCLATSLPEMNISNFNKHTDIVHAFDH